MISKQRCTILHNIGFMRGISVIHQCIFQEFVFVHRVFTLSTCSPFCITTAEVSHGQYKVAHKLTQISEVIKSSEKNYNTMRIISVVIVVCVFILVLQLIQSGQIILILICVC